MVCGLEHDARAAAKTTASKHGPARIRIIATIDRLPPQKLNDERLADDAAPQGMLARTTALHEYPLLTAAKFNMNQCAAVAADAPCSCTRRTMMSTTGISTAATMADS